MMNIADRIKVINENIRAACQRAGRDSKEIKLVIVTKSTTFENIEEVIRLGFIELGENRVNQLKKVSAQVSEFLEKQDDPAAPKSVNWHLIGHLQRNKVKQVLPIVSLIHSVDSLRLAEEINDNAASLNLCTNVLLQVNASNEPQKYGVPVGAAMHLGEQIATMSSIKLVGLMTMAPLTHDQEIIRTCFRRASELFVELKGEKIVGPDFKEMSMGMSSDYEIAIEQGATILRLGSAVFAGS